MQFIGIPIITAKVNFHSLKDYWFTKKNFTKKISDHYIRYCCVSVCVCLSVCPEHSSVGFDPILIKFWWEVYIMI